MSERSPAPSTELSRLRSEIERVDRDLVALIAERVRLAREIGAAKRESGQPTLDPAREAEVVRRAGTLAREAGLPDERVREIFWQLISLAREVQSPRAHG
jgi:chorismate mutase